MPLKSKPKKYREGGAVRNDDIPEERGPGGLRYNRLLQALRDERERERKADELLPDEDFEKRMRSLERQGFTPPTNEQLARRAGRKSAERTARVGSAQAGQRFFERSLEDEGKRIGQRRYADPRRMEDSGFKKGGLVKKKKAGGVVKKANGGMIGKGCK
jgi:hypothetical protein